MGTRITDLPVATTVNPADVLPIVQGGNTKQAASSLIKTTNASDLTTGTVAAARLPSATTGAAGIVQLGNTAGTACEGNDARLTNSRAPSGAAGGDLTGAYPNPTLVPLNPSPAGTFGSASTIPVVSVNNKGQVTGVSTVTPAARVSSVDVSGGTTGLSFNNGPITTAGTLLMTGTVNIASGGTGATSAAQARTNLGLPASATVDTTNASNITSGTLNPARLPGLTGDVIAAASSNFTALTTTGVAAGTWGGPSQIPVVTVDAKGRVTSITDVVPSISASNITGGTLATAQLPASGVVSGIIGSSSQIPVLTVDEKGRITAAATANFPNTGVTPGTYGQNNAIPQIEVDAQGRITNVTNIGISGSAGGTVTSVGIASSTLSVTNTPVTFTGDIGLELPTVLSPDTVGSSTAIPVITADAQGRITALATAAIPGLSATGVVAGTYGDSGSVGSFSVNEFGQLTGATSSLIAISSAQITGTLATSQLPAITSAQITGVLATSQIPAITSAQITGVLATSQIPAITSAQINGLLATSQIPTLPTTKISGLAASATTDTTNASNITAGALPTAQLSASPVTPGTYGSGSQVAVLGIDSKGRVTSASNVAISAAAGVSTFSAGTTGLTPSTATSGAVTLGGTLGIASGGTGSTFASGALFNLGGYPSSNPSGFTSNTGTVTSVSGTGTVSGLSLSGTVTGSGNITLGGTLAVTASNFASQTANTVLSAPNGTAGVPTFRALAAADIPTLNQNTTGTAANVTGTVAIANGGTGSTTQQGAVNALAGAVTNGQFLRGNGTNVVMSAIQAADVPTLNQNTTGTAANVTGTVAIANGGTGATTAANALSSLGAYPASNPSGFTSNAGTVTSVSGTGTVSGLSLSGTVTGSGNLTLGGTLSVAPANFASQTANTILAAPNGTAGAPTFRALAAADIPTLNQNTTGTAANVTGTVAVANGGTGATTLTGYVKGTGTAALTGSASVPVADISGTLPINKGGTASTSATNATLEAISGKDVWSGGGEFAMASTDALVVVIEAASTTTIVILPDATVTSDGRLFLIGNNKSSSLSVRFFGTTTTYTTIPAGKIGIFTCTGFTNTAASWMNNL